VRNYREMTSTWAERRDAGRELRRTVPIETGRIEAADH
jgi:hypothetical protein